MENIPVANIPVANEVNDKIPVAVKDNNSRTVLIPVKQSTTHKSYANPDYEEELSVYEEPSLLKNFKNKATNIRRSLQKAVRGENSGRVPPLTGGKYRTKKKSSRYKSRKSKKTRRKSRRKSNRRRR